MITKRESFERGQLKWSWLKAKYTFSFGSYFDPDWMGFGPLRVINEDIIDEGRGFDTHPHKDMEIISYVLEGEIKHKDTLGNNSTITSGQIQIMSAGSGILHSEFNPNLDRKTHMLQIWIEPNKKGVSPRYEQFNVDLKTDELPLIVTESGSHSGDKNVATIYQDLKLFHGSLKNFSQKIDKTKKYWIQIAKGDGTINEVQVVSGDGIILEGESVLDVLSDEGLLVLVFEI